MHCFVLSPSAAVFVVVGLGGGVDLDAAEDPNAAPAPDAVADVGVLDLL